MKTVFLPPGVQRRIGPGPYDLPDDVADAIERLWKHRNTAPESELEAIDREMERVVLCPGCGIGWRGVCMCTFSGRGL